MNALRPILRKTDIRSLGYSFEATYHVFVGAKEFELSEKFDDIDLHCERWKKRMANGYLHECILKPEYNSLEEAFEHLYRPITVWEQAEKKTTFWSLTLTHQSTTPVSSMLKLKLAM